VRRANEKPTDTSDRYKWIALSNTTLGMLMATIDGSIVIVAMPAIFRGIHLDPLAPGNIGFLLWMILGYLLVTAVLVVALGRLGDMFGRVRLYNMGFAIFSATSLILSLDPFTGSGGALWLIGWRTAQAVGGAMLMSSSAAVLTDAFPADQRGMALGVNQIAGLSGQFLGLLLGGVLAEFDWRSVFWINVPIGIAGTIWSYRTLREVGVRRASRVDWAGNLTFTCGTALLLIGITYGIQPYGTHTTGWANPMVLGLLGIGVALLAAFITVERHTRDPMFELSLFRIRAFAAGNAASLLTAIARGGLQFMLVIWLQGIWLPLHNVDYSATPLWAGICMLPLTTGFIIAGPVAGILSDRFGVRLFATSGLTIVTVTFLGLLALPVDFTYWQFALLLLFSGIGQGLFAAPNTSAIMSSVPPERRGVASGMRSTFQNSGMSLSIGVFFSLMTIGLASRLPVTLAAGLHAHGVPTGTATQLSTLPPVSTMFAAFLGQNPVGSLLTTHHATQGISPHDMSVLTSTQFFPQLISAPFHHGLMVVFTTAAVMSALAAVTSALRGGRTTRPTPQETPTTTGASVS
jgi:MFS family permease